MTPFIAWSQARPDPLSPDISVRETGDKDSCGSDFEAELSLMLDEMIQNLMTSSVMQLRGTLRTMEQAREEQRRKDRSKFILDALLAIEEKTAAVVAEALLPVLSQLQLSQVMDEFTCILKKILPEFAQQSLRVDAPADLHDKLTNALQSQSISAEITVNQGNEIVVASDHVALKADLRQWSNNLSMAVGL